MDVINLSLGSAYGQKEDDLSAACANAVRLGVIVVASATPVGVLITIFAAEYKSEPEFISTAVVISTALSPIFVTGWILVTRLY